MLQLTIPPTEIFDHKKREFIKLPGYEVELEHSLVSLSKWESKYKKRFIGYTMNDANEVFDYIRMMCVTPNTDPRFVLGLTKAMSEQIREYIQTEHTATTINEVRSPKSSEAVSSELIYYWMTAYNIPFTCETWNLSRLLMLIRICSIKQEKPKKMGRAEAMSRQRSLNAQRRAQLNSSG